MNKSELIAASAQKSGLTQKDAGKVLDAVLDSIIEAVAKDDKVQLIGFGTFEARQRAERIGRNPQTKAEIKIPATKVPAFAAGKAFKDAVSSK